MFRFRIRKDISNDYAHGYEYVSDGEGRQKTFPSKKSAADWLKSHKEFNLTPELFTIEPCII